MQWTLPKRSLCSVTVCTTDGEDNVPSRLMLYGQECLMLTSSNISNAKQPVANCALNVVHNWNTNGSLWYQYKFEWYAKYRFNLNNGSSRHLKTVQHTLSVFWKVFQYIFCPGMHRHSYAIISILFWSIIGSRDVERFVLLLYTIDDFMESINGYIRGDLLSWLQLERLETSVAHCGVYEQPCKAAVLIASSNIATTGLEPGTSWSEVLRAAVMPHARANFVSICKMG